VNLSQSHLGAPTCPPSPKVLWVRECGPTFFFFYCFVLGPTFRFLKEFGGGLMLLLLMFQNCCTINGTILMMMHLNWWSYDFLIISNPENTTSQFPSAISHIHDIGRFFSSLQSKQVKNSYKGVGFSMEVVVGPMLHITASPIFQACSSFASWSA
jgi:hypothetical protein